MAQALLPVSVADASYAGTQARVPVPLSCPYEAGLAAAAGRAALPIAESRTLNPESCLSDLPTAVRRAIEGERIGAAVDVYNAQRRIPGWDGLVLFHNLPGLV